jgi:hypothetical protein
MLRSLLPTALALVLLAGCATAPSGDPFPAPPTRSLDAILGIDRGDDGALLDATQEERFAQLLTDAALLDAATDDELARAIRTGEGTKQDAETSAADGTDASPDAAPASWRTRAITPVAAGGTPGIDLPVETTRSTTTTGTRDGRDYTTTTTDTSTIRDQRETTVHDATTTIDDPESGKGSTERVTVTQEKDACAGPGEPAGNWTIEQAQTINRGGLLLFVNITTSGTVVPNADGTVALRNLTVVLDSHGSGPDGTTAGTGFRVDVDIDSWDTRGDLTDTRGRWTVADTDGISEKDATALAGAQLDAYRAIAYDIASRSDELRRNSGVCVRIIVDTHGETTLADGEQADFDARVIDPATGEEIADAVIRAESHDGSVSPASATGHGSFTFTASGDPEYRVGLSTDTPRGGHDTSIRYGAAGWSFEGLSYGYTIPGGIAVEITWQGRVCGDYTGEWQLDWQIRSAYGSPAATGTQRPVELEDVTRGTRAILVYEEIPNPRDGEPPFRLWIDDENPGKTPAQQRVEIHPEPLEGACSPS